MEDILKLSEDLNIYSRHHVYKEVNRTVNCIAKKDISIIDSRICLPYYVTNISFKDYYGSLSNRLYKLTIM